MKIIFLGGVEGVTGSKYLIEHNQTNILVDCGLFQGGKELRSKNRAQLPLDPKDIDAVVLTHAHIDHTGYVPLLVKKGFAGKVYCSKATFELCKILLADSGFLHEKEAEINGTEPLYTKIDATRSLKNFEVVEFNKSFSINKALEVDLTCSGHILGASFVRISDGNKTITFSGDLGRPNELIMKAPPYIKKTDFLVMESTYGNKLHDKKDPIEVVGAIVNKTLSRNGILIIPAFAIGRTQTMLYILYQLKHKKIIPDVPVFLDSPMAISVTDLLCQFLDEHKLPAKLCRDVCNVAQYTQKVEESKQLARIKGSAVIIAGSGMASGGRVLHHLKRLIGDPKNTVLFVGFQGEGTTGRDLVQGAKEVEMYEKLYSVNAEILSIESLSAHADYNEILEWMSHLENDPKKVFLTHGEPESSHALKIKIEERFGWSTIVPKYQDSFELF